ncbi:MAG: N-6 DNA methylase [Ignavibacteriales bacterium]|nr:N-6 DNA methylase [Ignavibacteriales bacterium]
MPLFQKSVVNKYLANLDSVVVAKANIQFQQFYGDTERIGNIRLLKEENYQEGFLREIFVDVLGYTINPNKNYNLTTEFKNLTDSKKADGAILFDEKAIGVIELKSTTTPNLESIRDQAFNYKNNQPNCRFVITSNFEKLRFYIDNATDWEEFNLFNLDFENFRKFYLYLSKDSIFNGITTKLKDESKLHEEDITSKLYNDYSFFKHQLFNDLIKLNPQQDKLLLFHKSQKLLDRILFVLFAEDRGLIPPNAITRIIDQWKTLKDLDEEKSLYSRFVKLFNHLDEGHKYKEYELPAYNGGLFKKDVVLDSLVINDNILHTNTIKLSTYDYNTEVDVNILGHIFENSITEIEQVKAEIEGEQTDKNRSRRKKEGIFYTPKYITKYIVDNTVGALCNEKKKELGIDEIENEIIENSRTVKGKLSKKAEALLKKLDDYRTHLLSLKILDPACGSGAFLNQALEFLINEHELIDSYRRELEKDSLGLYDITKSILENNLYGVDINEEAVEIAKLSLWIRTAERGRKLSDLNNNIKCGNSLIDDPAVAGDKAFDWKKEFPEIMRDGGFDVVIGNPPYVRIQELNHQEIDWFKDHKKTAYKRVDISILFFELGLSFLKTNGRISYISSNQFLTGEYGRLMRKYLLTDCKIEKIIDFADLPVFQDALTYVSIFVLSNNEPTDFQYKKVKDINEAISGNYKDEILINLHSLSDDSWTLTSIERQRVLEKIQKFPSLDSMGCKCWYGIVSGCDDIFILSKAKANELQLEEKLLLPLTRAQNCGRYTYSDYDLFVIYPYRNFNGKTELIVLDEIRNHYPNVYAYLLENKSILTKRKDSRKTFEEKDNWYGLTRFGQFEVFNQQKIVFPGECQRNKFGIDILKTGYSGARVFSITVNEKITIEILTGILNSGVVEFYLHSVSALKQGGYYSYSSTVIDRIPIPNTIDEIRAKIISEKVQIIFSLNDNLRKTINTFLCRIQSNFTIDKPSNKLKEFYNYDFKTFLSELKKKKVTLTLKQQDEWEQYFNEYKTETNKLQQQINQTDKEIDQLVYKLYGLTEEEISIVEGATSS